MVRISEQRRGLLKNYKTNTLDNNINEPVVTTTEGTTDTTADTAVTTDATATPELAPVDSNVVPEGDAIPASAPIVEEPAAGEVSQ